MQTEEMRSLIIEVCNDVQKTLLAKNSDYGGSVFKAPLLAPELDVTSAIRCRMSDKVERLIHLLRHPEQQQVAESIEDTKKDLMGYLVLELVAKRLIEREKIKNIESALKKDLEVIHDKEGKFLK